jgi:hypothetical protein
MIPIGFRLLAVLAALTGAMNYLLGASVKFPDPPGSDYISEGPFSKATALRARYRRRSAWSRAVSVALLAISLTGILRTDQ